MGFTPEEQFGSVKANISAHKYHWAFLRIVVGAGQIIIFLGLVWGAISGFHSIFNKEPVATSTGSVNASDSNVLINNTGTATQTIVKNARILNQK